MVFGQFQQILSLEKNFSGNRLAGGIGNQTHDGQRRDGLAAARFADETERLAFLEVVAYIVYRGGKPSSV